MILAIFFLITCEKDPEFTPQAQQNVYEYYARSQKIKESCPDVDKLAKELLNPQMFRTCGSHNYGILREASYIPPGGGYHPTANPTNQPLQVCKGGVCLNARCTTSYCSGATYTVIINYAKRLGVFAGMSAAQLENFKTKWHDNIGFWGLWNNSKRGLLDANNYIHFGSVVGSIHSACPGDLMKFDRWVATKKGKKQMGHSAIFLGISGGKYYYWTSSSMTGGFGISCESLSELITKETYILRVTDPGNLKNIKPFTNRLLL